jgi:hypothetical protein
MQEFTETRTDIDQLKRKIKTKSMQIDKTKDK